MTLASSAIINSYRRLLYSKMRHFLFMTSFCGVPTFSSFRVFSCNIKEFSNSESFFCVTGYSLSVPVKYDHFIINFRAKINFVEKYNKKKYIVYIRYILYTNKTARNIREVKLLTYFFRISYKNKLFLNQPKLWQIGIS